MTLAKLEKELKEVNKNIYITIVVPLSLKNVETIRNTEVKDFLESQIFYICYKNDALIGISKGNEKRKNPYVVSITKPKEVKSLTGNEFVRMVEGIINIVDKYLLVETK